MQFRYWVLISYYTVIFVIQHFPLNFHCFGFMNCYFQATIILCFFFRFSSICLRVILSLTKKSLIVCKLNCSYGKLLFIRLLTILRHCLVVSTIYSALNKGIAGFKSVEYLSNWARSPCLQKSVLAEIWASQCLGGQLRWSSLGACETSGSVVGWGTMLKAGRPRDRVPMRWIFFFSWPIPSSRTMALGSTQPLAEMSNMNVPGGKWRPACTADNLTAICEPTV
jgi:hypothetical protein